MNGISKKRPLSKILTIVIPAYKAETTINNTLESLNYQLGNYFDVLIVDDGNPNPLLPYIQPWIKLYPNVIKYVRTKNNNWGGVVNYAIKHVKTKYVKILDADDSFFTNDLQSYFESLQHISKTDCDIIINSYAIHDIKNNALMKRYYNLYNKTVFTNFDKRFFVKIITMHAMTWRTDFLKKMRPLPTKTSYTDNLLVFYSILASRQIALMPRHVFVYQYKFGYLDQSMLPNNMLSSLPKLINIFHQMLNFNDKDLTNKRIRSLINCIKQMFYLIMLIISLNKQIYHWQKKQQINAELTFLRKNCEMHNSYYNKLIKTGYLFFINKHTLPLIMKLNKLILITSQIGFLKLLKGQYKKYQREKVWK